MMMMQQPAAKAAVKRLVKKARKESVVGVPYYHILKQPAVNKPEVVYRKSKKARKLTSDQVSSPRHLVLVHRRGDAFCFIQ